MSSSHIAKTIAGVGIAGVAIASAALYNAQQEKDKERNRAKSMAEKAQAEMEKAKFERQKRRGDYTPKGKDGNAKAQFEHMFMIETMYTYVPKHIAMELANLRKALDNSFSAITASRSSNDSVVVFMACFAGIFDNRIRPREEYDEDDNEGWAQGKPVIATESDGAVHLIEHGENGLLSPIDKPSLLASSVKVVLFDSKIAQVLALSGRATFETRFTKSKVISQYRDFFSEITA